MCSKIYVYKVNKHYIKCKETKLNFVNFNYVANF